MLLFIEFSNFQQQKQEHRAQSLIYFTNKCINIKSIICLLLYNVLILQELTTRSWGKEYIVEDSICVLPSNPAEKPWGTDSKSQAEFFLESLAKA